MSRPATPLPATLSELYRRAVPLPATGCLVWNGRMVRGGYGQIGIGRARARELGIPQTILVHRLAWELGKGPIPRGMQIDHLCRNRACINVDHMEVVTPSENVLRGLGPKLSGARLRAWVITNAEAQTHCKRGHEFTPDNTYIHNGMRTCKECQRERVRAYRARLADGGSL